MATSKRRKKKPQSNTGGFKRFVRELSGLLRELNIDKSFEKTPVNFMRKMYAYKFHILNPEKGNNFITSHEIRYISERTKKYMHKKVIVYSDIIVSPYDLILLKCFSQILPELIKREEQGKNREEPELSNEIAPELNDAFIRLFSINFYNMIARLNSPDRKIYGANYRILDPIKEKPRLEIKTVVYGFPPRKTIIAIDGMKRPVFQLAKPVYDAPVEWVTINTGLLEDKYEGNHKTLEVYIQSHALRRLRERLDLLSDHSINYTLWENSAEIKEVICYKGYMLLPYKVFDTKVGYLVAYVIEEKFIIKTFLFITHTFTPEGDQLLKLTGLGRHDITYWKIDRLSTFVNLDTEENKDIIELFNEAGLGELMNLKQKEFDIESLHAHNLKGLMQYITKNQAFSLSEEFAVV